MSIDKTLLHRMTNDPKSIEQNEEFNNFMKRVGEVSKLVKDLSSGDKERAESAQAIADKYLGGKLFTEDDVTLKIKENRTVINHNAFKIKENNKSVSRGI